MIKNIVYRIYWKI